MSENNTISHTAERAVFFVSDQTGITAETLGKSLLTQFPNLRFRFETLSFITDEDKAHAAVRHINRSFTVEGVEPIVISTMAPDDLREILSRAKAFFMDFFDAFISPLELKLKQRSTHKSGRAHSADTDAYRNRISAINFSLANDDGITLDHYDQAEIILIGPSRSGKTPTCLFLALQYGIYPANFPLTDEQFDSMRLPRELIEQKHKVYGLIIDPQRLQQIRSERKANSQYASIQQVMYEVRQAKAIYRKNNIPSIDTTHYSVEEIASMILQKTGLERRL